jgi:hypothetical protein
MMARGQTARMRFRKFVTSGQTLTLPSPAGGRGFRRSTGPRPFSRLREKVRDEGTPEESMQIGTKV